MTTWQVILSVAAGVLAIPATFVVWLLYRFFFVELKRK